MLLDIYLNILMMHGPMNLKSVQNLRIEAILGMALIMLFKVFKLWSLHGQPIQKPFLGKSFSHI